MNIQLKNYLKICEIRVSINEIISSFFTDSRNNSLPTCKQHLL